MSSSKKKANASATPSHRRLSRTGGRPRQAARAIFDSSEKAWVVRRVENMEKLLRRCEKDPVELLLQVRELLREQVDSHAKAGRTSDSIFYGRLETYVYNLRMSLELKA